MIGAIIGDIVGSRFEFNNHRDKNFELFTEDCYVTDDSIMTLAVAKAIMETEKIIKPPTGFHDFDSDYYSLLEKMTIKYMQQIGRRYPNCGYGLMFSSWVFDDYPKPYNSFGNGAAMRISPVGFAARTESEACRLSEVVTAVTHNHEEGLKGAEATAVAIYMARRGFTKGEIRKKIERDYYSLDFTIDEIRDSYEFNETCQDTVPQAIEAFLESTSFEDAIRNAISIGGDSDTLAAITGSIAEAYYGVPEELKQKALSYLDDELRSIFNDWYEFIGIEGAMRKFKVLTKYIGKFTGVFDGIIEYPTRMPSLNFDELVGEFLADVYQFVESYPEYELSNYISILESSNLISNVNNVDVETLDAKSSLALIILAIRADRFSFGTLHSNIEDGSISKWLNRLKAIDNNNVSMQIEEIYFEIGGYGGFDTYSIKFNKDSATLITTLWYEEPIKRQYSLEETRLLLSSFEDLHIESWNSEYIDPFVCDGVQWKLLVKYKRHRGTAWVGSNAYPSNWDELLAFFGIENKEE